MDAYDLSDTDPLLQLDETGAGYQVVDVATTSHGGIRRFIALSASLLIRLDEYLAFLDGSNPAQPPEAFESFADFKRVLAPQVIQSLRSAPSLIPKTAVGGMVPPPAWPISPTLVVASTITAPTVMWRLSAVTPDPRIHAGQLRPGTYLTSDIDIRLATTGFGAVGRYALPFPFPASYVSRCVVPAGEIAHVGTTRPNFGQAGGGVEILISAIVGTIPASGAPALPTW
jgi:hypothetical protein